ncbi:PREDICTED: uncharacterized protein LOC106329881 [Brassica oleracea var. oleracea]|uniref:uncharacterized protein LOC106329881 n=1 Tax=Brassica oleracea var. oleracea TaxID=109376 RepID=UPI0006A6CFEE|nr:PREDICTED: uncharacterized protein LOC106329881 [Brassica oleracea var. oleracea]
MARPPVYWARFIWNQALIPKHRITSWLFMLNRNPTMDRLLSWGIDLENCCLLCGNSPESRDHLFFLCPYSFQVWENAIGVLGFINPPVQWELVLHWLSSVSNPAQLAAILQLWHGSIYVIWQERNARYHNGVTKPHFMLSREVIKLAKDKSTAMRSCGSDFASSLVALWSSF